MKVGDGSGLAILGPVERSLPRLAFHRDGDIPAFIRMSIGIKVSVAIQLNGGAGSDTLEDVPANLIPIGLAGPFLYVKGPPVFRRTVFRTREEPSAPLSITVDIPRGLVCELEV